MAVLYFQVNDMEEYMKEFDMLMKQQFAASSNATTSSAQEAERATVELVDLQEKVVKLEEGISERDATVATLLVRRARNISLQVTMCEDVPYFFTYRIVLRIKKKQWPPWVCSIKRT